MPRERLRAGRDGDRDPGRLSRRARSVCPETCAAVTAWAVLLVPRRERPGLPPGTRGRGQPARGTGSAEGGGPGWEEVATRGRSAGPRRVKEPGDSPRGQTEQALRAGTHSESRVLHKPRDPVLGIAFPGSPGSFAEDARVLGPGGEPGPGQPTHPAPSPLQHWRGHLHDDRPPKRNRGGAARRVCRRPRLGRSLVQSHPQRGRWTTNTGLAPLTGQGLKGEARASPGDGGGEGSQNRCSRPPFGTGQTPVWGQHRRSPNAQLPPTAPSLRQLNRRLVTS